jgi:hypothetical protein
VRDALARDLVGRAAAHVLAVEDDAPARGDHPGDGAQRGGLAGPVRAEDRHDLALLDVERDALEDDALAVARVHLLDLEQAHAAVPR